MLSKQNILPLGIFRLIIFIVESLHQLRYANLIKLCKAELPEDCEPKLENHQCLECERTSQREKINLKKGKLFVQIHIE